MKLHKIFPFTALVIHLSHDALQKLPLLLTDHRIMEWSSLAGTSGDLLTQFPCSTQGQAEQVSQGCVQSDFGYQQTWGLHNLSEKPLPELGYPRSRR